MNTSERGQMGHETVDPIVAHENAKQHALKELRYQVQEVDKMGKPDDKETVNFNADLLPVVLDLKGVKAILEKADPSDTELRPILERRLKGAQNDLAKEEETLRVMKMKRLKMARFGGRNSLDDEIDAGSRNVEALKNAVRNLEAETLALSGNN